MVLIRVDRYSGVYGLRTRDLCRPPLTRGRVRRYVLPVAGAENDAIRVGLFIRDVAAAVVARARVRDSILV